ncbi:MAG: carbohydrate-binding protein [Edaphobacter sp.]|nr:carbohydrate-binding protein [Edaphobacter sp.]
MRKSIVSPSAVATPPISDLWRDLERIARVEISSEDERFPIEQALGKKETTGWRAAGTGPQLIRLNFDEPINIKRLRLHFVDRATERSQEFAVFAGAGRELKEVVRQQWTFSPYGSTEEIEDYTVNLSGITTLELRIDPDRSHDPKQSQAYATLQSLKLA